MAIPQQGRAPQARPSLLPNDIADAIANLFGGGDTQGNPGIPGGLLPPGLDKIIQMIAQNTQGIGAPPQTRGIEAPPQQVPMGAGGPVSDEELAQMLNGGVPIDQEPQSEQVDTEQIDPGYTDEEVSPEDVFTTDPAGDVEDVADEMTGGEEEVGEADENVGPQVPVSGEGESDEPAAGFAALELGSSKNKREADQRAALEMILPDAPQQAVEAFMKLRPDDRSAAVTSYLRTHPRVKAQRYTPEVREQLKRQYPEWAGDIEVATDATMPGIVQQAAAQSHTVDKTRKTDLSRFSPEVRQYLEQMSPGDVSRYVAKHLAESEKGGGEGGDYWPRLKGKGIKIVNDDNFKRLGLKSGEKVCITIP